MSQYQNQNIVVIGASFGIGEELCRQLAKAGANLAICARSKDKIEKLSEELLGNHMALACDVSKRSDVQKLRNSIFGAWQKIDKVIFCVGIYQPMNVENFDLTKSKEILDVNFSSFLNVLDEFLDDFKSKNISHLAVISSVAGYFGMPNSLVYGASKAALINLTESLFYELRQYHTKVQLINPGFVKTRLTDQNNFKMPGIISTDKAAKTIIKKLCSRQFEIKFPAIFTGVMRFMFFLPYKIRFLLFKNVK
ncbi:MAG: SDR family NAD(P)-dependent oxidoreductase [Rickettsiales bacterium]|nr:SDR family NAD(P)-dependent oxidoreductase [Rickettsiales bacterium]